MTKAGDISIGQAMTGIYNFVSFFGIFVLMFIAWLFSVQRRNVNWRVVFWGVGLQLIFGFFIFNVSAGLLLFKWINKLVVKTLSFAFEGMYFVFGPLAVSPGTIGPGAEKSLGFILAFQALPVAVFFSSLMALLYYFGIMQKVVRFFSLIFTKLMRLSGAESLYAAGEIVVGIESAFSIRPYLEGMTESELCLVLTAGMSTIASTVLAIYVGFLYKDFPAIAGHLISASVLSAPASIVMAKLLYPEDKHPKTLGNSVSGYYLKAASWIEAVIKGAQEGARMVLGIVTLLLAFLGLLAMANWLIGFLGANIGRLIGLSLNLSLQKILSFFYYPLTLIMGVPPEDASKISLLLGERSIATELFSYQHLGQYISSGALVNPRSIIIVSYALCGFAHIASLAIFVGGISALTPSRSGDLARLSLRALFAATLACLMTGALAGVFVNASSNTILGL